jgi:hypothetical protein
MSIKPAIIVTRAIAVPRSDSQHHRNNSSGYQDFFDAVAADATALLSSFG